MNINKNLNILYENPGKTLEQEGLIDTARYLYHHTGEGRKYYDLARNNFLKDDLLYSLLVTRENLSKYIYLEGKKEAEKYILYLIKLNKLILDYLEILEAKIETPELVNKKMIKDEIDFIILEFEKIKDYLFGKVPFDFENVWKKEIKIEPTEEE